jgi:Cys-tRNA(Pro)/Cys-tRNA(Cys) deacylase
MTANNITRFLDARNIAYRAFDLPIEKLGALEAAQFLDVPTEQVFKSIVVVRSIPGKPLLAVIPGPLEVNLKAVANLAGEKKVQIPTLKEAERLTGLKAGGISPLALLNHGFQILLDESVYLFDEIYISGGQLGLNIRLGVTDLIQLIHPLVGDISLVPEA